MRSDRPRLKIDICSQKAAVVPERDSDYIPCAYLNQPSICPCAFDSPNLEWAVSFYPIQSPLVGLDACPILMILLVSPVGI